MNETLSEERGTTSDDRQLMTIFLSLIALELIVIVAIVGQLLG